MMAWNKPDFAIILAFAGGQLSVFAIYLGPRWLAGVLPIVTAFAAAALING